MGAGTQDINFFNKFKPIIPQKNILFKNLLNAGSLGKQFFVNYFIDETAKNFKTSPKVIVSEALRRHGWNIGDSFPKEFNPLLFYMQLLDRWGTLEEQKQNIQEFQKGLERNWQKGKLKLLDM